MGAGENTKAELLLCNPSRADDLRMALVAAAVLMAEKTLNVDSLSRNMQSLQCRLLHLTKCSISRSRQH